MSEHSCRLYLHSNWLQSSGILVTQVCMPPRCIPALTKRNGTSLVYTELMHIKVLLTCIHVHLFGLHSLTGHCSSLQHCRSCGQIKASEDFPRNRMNKDGLHSYCKPCQNAKCAQYQRNSLAAKQEGRPVAGTPADVALPDEPFNTHKVCNLLFRLSAAKMHISTSAFVSMKCKGIKRFLQVPSLCRRCPESTC